MNNYCIYAPKMFIDTGKGSFRGFVPTVVNLDTQETWTGKLQADAGTALDIASAMLAELLGECDCVLPGQDCPVCRAAAVEADGEEILY